jgi:hypothetical protein
MANLVLVGSQPAGWAGNTIVLFDGDTGLHYVVSTIHPPWRTTPETLAYPTDPKGSIESVPGYGTERLGFVAGGLMNQLDGVCDLSCRLDDDVLLTPEQAIEVEAQMYDTEFAEFTAYLGVAA